MRVRLAVAVLIGLSITLSAVARTEAGYILCAIIDKHKSNPESLHNKLKHKKAMGGGIKGHLHKNDCPHCQ